jgi:PPOX class probable F420-dependent enzyme
VAELKQEYREFLDNPYYAVVTTLRPDGSPHNTVVWVDVDENGVLGFNTSIGRAKERHLRNDPRVAVMVVNPANAYHWVSVSGTGELTTEGGDAHIDSLSNKYLGKDYPYRQPGEQRVSIRVHPDRIEATGFDA